MQVLTIILLFIILLQFILLYKMSQKTKFKLNDIETVNDMQQYLQMLDNKFETKYNNIDDVVSSLNQQINNFGLEAKQVVSDASKEVKTQLIQNKNLLDTQNIELFTTINKIKENVSVFDDYLIETKSTLASAVKMVKDEITVSLMEEILPLKNHILKDFERLKRYEEGYDLKIFKRYTNELFRILDFIKKERVKNDSEVLEDIEEDILIMLENSGIKRLELFEGDTYDDSLDQYVKIEYEFTSDSNKANTIKEVKKYGYFLTSLGNKGKTIKKPMKEARIVISKLERNGDKI